LLKNCRHSENFTLFFKKYVFMFFQPLEISWVSVHIMEEDIAESTDRYKRDGSAGPPVRTHGSGAVSEETPRDETLQSDSLAAPHRPHMDKGGDVSLAAPPPPHMDPLQDPLQEGDSALSLQVSPSKSKTRPATLSLVSPQSSRSATLISPSAPLAYSPNGVRGGRFGQGTPKSDVEWKCIRAAQIPGPGAYGSPDAQKLSGGRFSTGNPKSDVEWEMLRASKIPAPGQYEIRSSVTPGGKFSTGQPKSDLEWKMIRAAAVSPHSTFHVRLLLHCHPS